MLLRHQSLLFFIIPAYRTSYTKAYEIDKMFTWWKIVLSAIVAFIISYVAVPIVKAFAEKIKVFDISAYARRIHDHPIPLLGGLAVWLGFVVAALIFAPVQRQTVGLLAGATLITLLGALDDKFDFKPWAKLLGQVAAAAIVIYSGFSISNLSFISSSEAAFGIPLGWLSVPITILWIVLCTNAMNLIDGLDGLAAGISAIAAATLLVVSVLPQAAAWYVPILLAAFLGACLGFLPYNLFPAKIFLGDTGSQLLGYLLSTLSIMGLVKFHAIVPLVVPVLALALPLGDTAFAMVRRIINKRSIFSADSGHIHHRLLAIGMSQRQVVAVLYVITLFFCIVSLLVIRPGNHLLRVALIVFVLVIAFLAQFMFFPIKTNPDEEEQTVKSDKKHILVVSQYFYPENFRINDMTCEWVKRGYQVTVLTGVPNYPVGEFFPGYSWTKKRHEIWNGVEILRIPVVPRGRGPIGMVLNYYSFVVTGWIWNWVTEVNADIVFSFETSPMTQLKVGCRYAKIHKVPHFAYVQDLWPENVEVVTGIHNKMIIQPIDRMVDQIYRDVDEIFVTSPSFVEAVVNRKHPVPREKVHYWPQYAEDYFRPMAKADVFEIPRDDSLKIAFTGNLGFAQGLDILPKTAELMKDENIKFIIVGGGRYQERFEDEIRERQVQEKFVLIPRQTPERIPEILSACDAGFVSFAKDPLWENTIPAKLQTYMACGKAIIASASGETERIVREADCGICTECGNPEALAEGIHDLMNSDREAMGRNAREYFEVNFSKKKLMDEMDAYFAARIGNGNA